MDGGPGLHTARRHTRRDGIAAPPRIAPPYSFRPPPIQERHGQATNTWKGRIVGGPLKRAFDIAASASALLLLSPALAGIWVAVKLESPGPGFFRQRRGGFQGRPFHIYKFRTMRTCEDKTISQAKQADDRITKLGEFLRAKSIDELPQLINVLMGDMSIVGPRPHALAHDRQFSTLDRRYIARHHARPGITGLAQVSGSRGLTDTPEKIRIRTEHDLRYVTNWSWRMDVDILVKTVSVVLNDKGAF
jgi:putative colanic acid biosysnthesis UDP-glucose lipid carrier transferase